jgi:hypothetical protein
MIMDFVPPYSVTLKSGGRELVWWLRLRRGKGEKGRERTVVNID